MPLMAHAPPQVSDFAPVWGPGGADVFLDQRYQACQAATVAHHQAAVAAAVAGVAGAQPPQPVSPESQASGTSHDYDSGPSAGSRVDQPSISSWAVGLVGSRSSDLPLRGGGMPDHRMGVGVQPGAGDRTGEGIHVTTPLDSEWLCTPHIRRCTLWQW